MNSKIQWVAYTTIVSKEVGRFMRIWKQTLLPPIITQSLYFIIFGGFIGSQIRNINGVPYMQFIIPGLVMMAIITGSFTNVSFSFYSSKFQRSIEELLVSPMKTWVMLAGYVTGGVLRGLVTGLVVFLVSFFFTQPVIHSFFALLVYAVLTSTIFSLGGFINGVFANSFDDVGVFPTFVLTPLIYLGGVFYPVTALPAVWQKVSVLNPVVYMVDGFRYGVTGTSEFPLVMSAGILLAIMAAVVFVTVQILRKGAGLKT